MTQLSSIPVSDLISASPVSAPSGAGKIPWIPILGSVALGLALGYMISQEVNRRIISGMKQQLEEQAAQTV